MSDSVARVRSWLTELALPFWAARGVDRDAGGFVERLFWDGTPDFAAPKRTRVQARQIFVYSHASVLGLAGNGAEVAAHGYGFLMRHACPEGAENGFVRSVDRDGSPVDRVRDSYDHAFVMLAFSWFYRATGRQDVRCAIETVFAAIQNRLALPDGGGVAVDESFGPERQQNPNMHLFEALLAAEEATGDARYAAAADGLFGLFRRHLFDGQLRVLREYYDSDWQPAAGDEGRIVEPGHHCEWVWLLKRYADLRGEPICPEALHLAAFVDEYRTRAGSVMLSDQLWTDGSIKKPDFRSWPQTEAIKAHVALAEVSGGPIDPHAEALIDALFANFLSGPTPGGWIDWIDTKGTPLVDKIPASTLYHLYLGFAEYLKARGAA